VDRLNRRRPAVRRLATNARNIGFVDAIIGPRVDTFGGAPGEA